MTVWELRFRDGRGTSVFTTQDVTSEIGAPGKTRRFEIAAESAAGRELADARRCLAEGSVVELVANMAAIAYAVRHEL